MNTGMDSLSRLIFSILTPQEIQNFVEDLHHLEREITYPIEGGEDRFLERMLHLEDQTAETRCLVDVIF